MLHVIKVDFRKILIGKSYWRIVIAASIIYPLLRAVFLSILYHAVDETAYIEMTDFMCYFNYSTIVIATLVTEFLHSEFHDGVMRNKLVSGQDRKTVFLSISFILSVVTMVMQSASEITVLIAAKLLGEELKDVIISELIKYSFVAIVTGIAIAIFYTAIYMCLENYRFVIAIPISISVFVKIVLTYILDKLYPSSGVCSLTGVRLVVYKMIDRFIPFAYCEGAMRWNLSDYISGTGILLLLSLIIGLTIFQRKDLV